MAQKCWLNLIVSDVSILNLFQSTLEVVVVAGMVFLSTALCPQATYLQFTSYKHIIMECVSPSSYVVDTRPSAYSQDPQRCCGLQRLRRLPPPPTSTPRPKQSPDLKTIAGPPCPPSRLQQHPLPRLPRHRHVDFIATATRSPVL